jgi:mannose-6-phosphate isomerase-like protein (cupin superfamily)
MQIRRVVTGHDQSGKAVVLHDGIATNTRRRAFAGTASTLLWVTDGAPADIDGLQDQAERTIATAPPPGGSILRIVDFTPLTPQMEAVTHEDVARELGVSHHGAPGRHPFEHRTRSIDYAIIMSGEIDMLLDDSEIHLKAGDILIQQGTNHTWLNRGTEPCRIAFVLIDAAEPAAWSKRK